LQADAGKLEGPPEGSLKAFALSQTDFVMLIANQAVLSGQVLPCLLANLTADSGKDDHLVHWVVALLRWLFKTCWNKRPDDDSLIRSDELLFAFQDASEKIVHFQENKAGETKTTGWNMPKMACMATFRPATVRNGHSE
jgi:hypothetical protein